MSAALLVASLELIKQRIQALEISFPELTVLLDPLRRLGERASLQPPGASLRVPTAGDEAGALEHPEMLGDGRLTHGKGLGQFRHGSLA